MTTGHLITMTTCSTAWLALTAVGAAAGCAEKAAPASAYDWNLPAGQPAPLVPVNNPMTDAKVTLGRHLFYDPRLSVDGSMSCASCHEQERAFSDGLALPTGATGDTVPRNAMGLTNIAYRATYGWSNPVLTTLEDQALVPLLAEFPLELGVSGREEITIALLADDPLYETLFLNAFGDDTTVHATPLVTLANIVAAIASFERTLLSYDSAYDRWLHGDGSAMSDAAIRGHDLFFSERAECYHCHGGSDFSNSIRSVSLPNGVPAFHNTGLYNIDDNGAYPAPNVGLIEFSRELTDMGRFRVPSLRNIAVTAPYMHDGSAATLEDVLDHYIAGGRTIVQGPKAGIGATSPYRDPLIRPLDLSPRNRVDLIAFLKSLTDHRFLKNPALSDPWTSARSSSRE